MKYVLLIWLIVILGGCVQPAANQSTPPDPATSGRTIYFPQTGHSVQPPFVDYFEGHNELALLGYPITEAFEHNGWLVQYFRNGRLEFHPENEPAYRVTVGWLGQRMHRTLPPQRAQPTGVYVEKSGHTVQADFLAFFQSNNNTVQFGLPLSEPFLCDGLICQDFQSARLIWNPTLPPGRRVHLAPLGEDYFLESGLSLAHLASVDAPPGAKKRFAVPQAMPADATVTLTINRTANPRVVRVSIMVTQNGIPLAQQSPYLSWLTEKKQFLPTTSAGQTHILVIFPQSVSDITFAVHHPQTNETLAAQRYALIFP